MLAISAWVPSSRGPTISTAFNGISDEVRDVSDRGESTWEIESLAEGSDGAGAEDGVSAGREGSGD
ncbi:MAG TPA: hypothetical protein DEQ80_04050 [Anaerolinea thermolimosa]|uniref:Uncharacterized protein n=1 Tax=Anaerolinea thermolimosa TaxID=229919 RepID=A0A3D1JER4_9CHLR|nr:hypothetical protein [Anaerolinea thermolimosa]